MIVCALVLLFSCRSAHSDAACIMLRLISLLSSAVVKRILTSIHLRTPPRGKVLKFQAVGADILEGDQGRQLFAGPAYGHVVVFPAEIENFRKRWCTWGVGTDAMTMNSLLKPAEPSVDQSATLQKVWENPGLKVLVGKMKSIPTLPTLYSDVMTELKGRDPSLAKIGQIIAKDLGMSAKMLQVINSAYFGVPTRVTSPAQAAMLLGLDTTKALVLSIGVFANLDKIEVKGFTTKRLWEHSLRVGLWASRIAESERLDKTAVDEAFTAGLLHDIGTLALVMNRTSQYLQVMRQIDEQGVPIQTAERRIFKATHAEIGAYLVNTWGLPESIAEAVAFHHSPLKSGNQRVSPLTAVYVADNLEYETVADEDAPSHFDTDRRYLDAIGVSDRLPAWRESCQML